MQGSLPNDDWPRQHHWWEMRQFHFFFVNKVSFKVSEIASLQIFEAASWIVNEAVSLSKMRQNGEWCSNYISKWCKEPIYQIQPIPIPVIVIFYRCSFTDVEAKCNFNMIALSASVNIIQVEWRSLIERKTFSWNLHLLCLFNHRRKCSTLLRSDLMLNVRNPSESNICAWWTLGHYSHVCQGKVYLCMYFIFVSTKRNLLWLS